MKIISYKKTSRGRYIITLDNNKLTLYEDVILNNNLLFQKDITLELLEKVMNENNYYQDRYVNKQGIDNFSFSLDSIAQSIPFSIHSESK